MSEWEDPANVEEASQFTTTFNVDGELQDGYVNVPDAEIREVQYVFRGTDAVTAGSGGTEDGDVTGD